MPLVSIFALIAAVALLVDLIFEGPVARIVTALFATVFSCIHILLLKREERLYGNPLYDNQNKKIKSKVWSGLFRDSTRRASTQLKKVEGVTNGLVSSIWTTRGQPNFRLREKLERLKIKVNGKTPGRNYGATSTCEATTEQSRSNQEVSLNPSRLGDPYNEREVAERPKAIGFQTGMTGEKAPGDPTINKEVAPSESPTGLAGKSKGQIAFEKRVAANREKIKALKAEESQQKKENVGDTYCFTNAASENYDHVLANGYCEARDSRLNTANEDDSHYSSIDELDETVAKQTKCPKIEANLVDQKATNESNKERKNESETYKKDNCDEILEKHYSTTRIIPIKVVDDNLADYANIGFHFDFTEDDHVKENFYSRNSFTLEDIATALREIENENDFEVYEEVHEREVFKAQIIVNERWHDDQAIKTESNYGQKQTEAKADHNNLSRSSTIEMKPRVRARSLSRDNLFSPITRLMNGKKHTEV